MITHEIEKKNLVFKIIEYGLKKERFTMNQLMTDLKLDEGELDFVYRNLYKDIASNSTSSNHIIAGMNLSAIGNTNPPCALLPTAIFQYVDWLEIKEARKAATKAKYLSWIAIGITLFIGVIQSYLAFKALK